MKYIRTKLLSQINQKILEVYFQDSSFSKFWPYTRSDQTSPSGILNFIKHSLRAYHKNFSSLGPMGAEIMGLENSNFEKHHFQGFMKKGPQGPPKREKINSDGFSSGFRPQWFTKKNSSIFGTVCHKVCTERRQVNLCYRTMIIFR